MEGELTRIFEMVNTHLYVAAGVFTRIGAAMMLLPGLGERSMSVRTRLGAALAVAVLLMPMIRAMTPFHPQGGVDLLMMLAAEAAVGLIIGLAFRLLVFALQITGMVAAQHLSVAQMFGSGVAPEPEPTIATLLSFGGIVMALMAGLHVHFVAVLVELYDVFPFGIFPGASGLGAWATMQMSVTFALGVTLAAPFVAIGFLYNLALGALNRAMPQLLVALVGVPFLVWIGMIILYLVLPGIYAEWDRHLAATLIDPLGGIR
ncbi:MAG: flagellar biosynthetic protein FliR [Pseudomonadota bacterium]